MQTTITLTDAEYKALAHVAVDPIDLIHSSIHHRCHVAMEGIVAAEVQRKLAAGEPITGTKDDIVMAAPIKSAAERQAEMEAELAARAAEQAAGQQEA